MFSVLSADKSVSEELVRHPGVDKVAFTGSTAAGRRIGGLCGESLKRVSLELGGKSASVLLDDVDSVFPRLVGSGLLNNNGEACMAQTRVVVPRSRYEEVVSALADAATGVRIGDPLDPDTELGPLVSEAHRHRVEGYIEVGRHEGAKVVCGGGRPAGLDRGWYVEPTVFGEVDNTMRIAREEIFGPVIAVIPTTAGTTRPYGSPTTPPTASPVASIPQIRREGSGRRARCGRE